MVRFLENHSLIRHNTFGIHVFTDSFFEFTESADLDFFFHRGGVWEDQERFILGGGSNVLFTGDFHGLILHPNVPGIQRLREDNQHIWIEAGAGEEWDELVNFCVSSGWSGLENLSGIPGKVGAAPVQNIGAYGCEAGSTIERVHAYDLQKRKPVEIPASQCQFGYRSSIFKKEFAGRMVITSVVFKLNKIPEFLLNYGSLKKEVHKLGPPTLRNVRQAVCAIRTEKLPDYGTYGNAGSFFKNPSVGKNTAEKLKKQFPDMPVFTEGHGKTKLAAGWLIEQCGWKGFRVGDAGVHDKQALVLVNYGKATGKDILTLAGQIKHSVAERFGVDLEPEVTIL
jgi:UDP-N-acetylmuramate dehydrogenase